MLWKGPNGSEALLTCIIRNYKSFCSTLGSLWYPWGIPKGSIRPKTEHNIINMRNITKLTCRHIWAPCGYQEAQGGPIWPVIIYDTREKCFRAIWTLPEDHRVLMLILPASPCFRPNWLIWDPLGTLKASGWSNMTYNYVLYMWEVFQGHSNPSRAS